MEKIARDEDELSPVVDGVFYDRLESAGVVTEAFFEAVLRIAQVEIACVDEVHVVLRWFLGLKMVVGAG